LEIVHRAAPCRNVPVTFTLDVIFMNPAYFGDSYDVVKRFFCSELRSLGYNLVVDPMLTGSWEGAEKQFFRFLGAAPYESAPTIASPVALLIDPDTGVGAKSGRQHVTLERIAELTRTNAIVFSFDQSFSRKHQPKQAMRRKLEELAEYGCRGAYYDSHARFLFASSEQLRLEELVNHLVSLGMPESRFVGHDI